MPNKPKMKTPRELRRELADLEAECDGYRQQLVAQGEGPDDHLRDLEAKWSAKRAELRRRNGEAL